MISITNVTVMFLSIGCVLVVHAYVGLTLVRDNVFIHCHFGILVQNCANK